MKVIWRVYGERSILMVFIDIMRSWILKVEFCYFWICVCINGDCVIILMLR